MADAQIRVRHPAYVSVRMSESLVAYRVLSRSAIFLLHIALEIPVAIQGLLAPMSLPLLGLNNTTLVILKVRQDHNCVRISN